ncbi:gag-pol polyprotein, partial [Trifolium medium]|nr:gag-pol polyprotein [Trifolium medium]
QHSDFVLSNPCSDFVRLRGSELRFSYLGVPSRQTLNTTLQHLGKLVSGTMEIEGGYTNMPPMLNGSNYDYWKSRMEVFLKSIDSKTWKAVVRGWKHPVLKDTTELKSEDKWTKVEDELALENFKALNVLFNGVDNNMFKLIKQCTVAKDAWEI